MMTVHTIKKVYHTLIYNDQISGRQICMLLYEQGYLKKDKTMLAKLRTGMIAAISVFEIKIKFVGDYAGRTGTYSLCRIGCYYGPKYRKSKSHGILSEL